MGVRALLIDNYDSYTYNLFQLIAEVNGGKRFAADCFCCHLYSMEKATVAEVVLLCRAPHGHPQ